MSLIEPGRVDTDLVDLSPEEEAREKRAMKMLEPDDIARCITFGVSQPPRCDGVALQIGPLAQVI